MINYKIIQPLRLYYESTGLSSKFEVTSLRRWWLDWVINTSVDIRMYIDICKSEISVNGFTVVTMNTLATSSEGCHRRVST